MKAQQVFENTGFKRTHDSKGSLNLGLINEITNDEAQVFVDIILSVDPGDKEAIMELLEDIGHDLENINLPAIMYLTDLSVQEKLWWPGDTEENFADLYDIELEEGYPYAYVIDHEDEGYSILQSKIKIPNLDEL